MNDTQIINCTRNNVSTLSQIETLVDALYEIPGVDTVNVDGIRANIADLEKDMLRAHYEAEIRYNQKKLATL